MSFISPRVASKLMIEFASLAKRSEERQQQSPDPRLTEREKEVLRLVARGLSNREVAEELLISNNAVKSHVRNILEKVQLHSGMDVVVKSLEEPSETTPRTGHAP